MECHEGATMIKTFRGLIAHGEQDTIVLHTNDGSTGYRVVKLQIIDYQPGNAAGAVDVELVCKIYKRSQTISGGAGVNGTVDFSDNTLLGIAYYQGGNLGTEQNASTIIFDNEIFNQDIYVTMNEGASGGALRGNYYLELEQIRLDLSESTVATLKDIRNITTPA